MQQQQHDIQQQNGMIATGQPGVVGIGGGTVGSPPGSFGTTNKRAQINGGRFDFEDGGTYCGGWEEGKAHGYGVCTGPKHQGAYSGSWNYGFEVTGVYIWPSGSNYEGQWQNGRRHGLGVEQRGRLIYRGEWSNDGHKGRYGVRQSTTSTAKFEGTWNHGFQDGYGVETYADGGSYQGQWQEGKRHGYGIRTSAPFGLASKYRPKIHASMTSLTNNENPDPADKRNNRMDEVRGGFVLTAKSDDMLVRRNSLGEKNKKGFLSNLKMRKQRSMGDLEKRGTLASGSIRSTMSTASYISTGSSQSNMTSKSVHTESNASFTLDEDQLDASIVETYMGEWKKDKRDGYGVAERSDGLKYEGEWLNNKKHGYGVTTLPGGQLEEGKYKNNVLITSQKKKHLFLTRSRKFRERIQASIDAAQRSSKMALQRADIAISRTTTARTKAELADEQAELARMDCINAVSTAREFAPDFKPSVLERFEKLRYRERYRAPPIEPTQSAANSPMGIKDTQQSQNLAFHQQSQPAMTRRTSVLQRQASVEFPVPSSMYSQQMPVTPQTDLTQLVNQQQQQQQQLSQIYSQAHQMHNPQMNPAYQFQQQQPPGGNFSSSVSGQMSGGLKSSQYGSNYSNNNQQQMQQQMLQQQQLERNQIYTDYEANQQHQMQQQQQQHQQQRLIQQQLQQQLQQQHQQITQQNQYQQQVQQQQHHHQQQQQQHQQQQLAQENIQMQNSNTIRRNSRPVNESSKPMLGQTNQSSSIDHFDHYKRPPSRDSSVDRYARAASRMSGAGGGGLGSRQPSIDRAVGAPQPATNSAAATNSNPNQDTPDRSVRASSAFRSSTPAPAQSNGTPKTGNGSIPTGVGRSSSRAPTPSLQRRATPLEAMYSSPNQPFEDVLLRQRTLGQDIIPSPSQPKRTESLYVAPKPVAPIGGAAAGGSGNKKLKSVPITVNLQRKKSLPDFQELPRATDAMSREEVSALGSARREEVRRQIENNERLKANPLLYLVSPQVKDWFSRQQLVLLVLIVNVVLAIMFFKILT